MRAQQGHHLPAGSLNTSIEVMRQNSDVFESLETLELSEAFASMSELPPDLGSVLPALTHFECWSCNLTGAIPTGKLCLAPLPDCAQAGA